MTEHPQTVTRIISYSGEFRLANDQLMRINGVVSVRESTRRGYLEVIYRKEADGIIEAIQTAIMEARDNSKPRESRAVSSLTKRQPHRRPSNGQFLPQG